MEFVEGESAQSRLRRKGRLEPAEAIAIGTHIATALEYGWRKAQLIHRDIKPDNIFLSSDGEVKLGDLGLAKSVGESQSLTMTGSSMGTPHYVSPEQAQGKKDVDLRADIYSLGCTLFHLLTGQPPYDGDTAMAVMLKHMHSPVANLRQALPGCPETLARVVTKMMAKQPFARQQNHAEVIADLRRAYDGLAGAAMPAVVAVTQQPVGKQPPKQSPPAARKPVAPRPAAASVPGKRPSSSMLVVALALLAAFAALFHFAPWKRDGRLSEAERREKERAAQGSSTDDFRSLFDGTTLTGWEGLPGVWSVQDGAITGKTSTQNFITENTYLVWKGGDVSDFELKCKYRMVPDGQGPVGNSGINYRSRLVKPASYGVAGYQADMEMGPTHTGALYEEKGRGTLCKRGEIVIIREGSAPGTPLIEKAGTLDNSDKIEATVGKGDWNEYRIIAQGNHLQHFINGRQTVDVVDETSTGAKAGILAFELHGGPTMQVQFKDIQIKDRRPPGPFTTDAPTVNSVWKPFVTDAEWRNPPVRAGEHRDGLLHLAAQTWKKDQPSADGAIRARIVHREGSKSPALIMREQTGQGLYKLTLHDTGIVSLSLGNVGGEQVVKAKELGRFQMPALKPGDKVLLELRIQGDRLTGFVNGTMVIEARDAQVSDPGTWGIFANDGWFESVEVQAPAPAARATAATKDKPFVNTLGQEFVPVPGTNVLFSRWETRVKDYAAFAKAKTVDGSWQTQQKDGVPVGREPEHPVSGVSWDDANAFCKWLTEKEAKEGKLPGSARYRLPNDEEWSRAVGMLAESGNNPGPEFYPWGGGMPPKGKAGNYPDATYHARFPQEREWIQEYTDGFATTAPVGSFDPNPFGIYDLGGNVWEWCEDLVGPSRVLRGGSWGTAALGSLKVSKRFAMQPTSRARDFGFRCVLEPGPASALPATTAASAYPQPATWIDGTAQLRTYLASGELVAEGEWLHAPASVSRMFNLAPGRQFRNPIVRVRYSVPESGRVDICLRRVRKGNDDLRYNAGIDAAKVNLVMTRPADSPGPPDVLTRAVDLDPPTRPDEEHEAVFAAQGDTLTVWIDGRKVSTAQDSRLSSGELAMMTKNYASIGHCRIRKVEYAELPEAPAQTGSTPATSTKVAPLAVNTLGQEFVAVPGTQVLFCRWETRVKDYAVFAKAKTVVGVWQTMEKDGVPVGREPDHPVCGVSWDEAKAFCKWLTEKENAEGKLAKGFLYRLPTDEEWSRAVGLPKEEGATAKERSGKNVVDFPWGTGFPPKGKIGSYADEAYHGKFPNEKNNWIEGYSDGFVTTAPVGSFPANNDGIHDLGGNVWEWCEDWYDASQKERVLRGASWDSFDRNYLRSSFRHLWVPGFRGTSVGFRCVLAPATSAPPAVATYPQPAQWMDATAEFRKIHEAAGTLRSDGEWLSSAQPSGVFKVPPGKAYRNCILRVTFSERIDLVLRRRETEGDARYVGAIWQTDANIGMTGPTYKRIAPHVSFPAPLAKGEAHEAVFAAQGDTLTLWLDGKKVATGNDATLASGSLAVYLTKGDTKNGDGRIRKIEYGELDAAPAPAGR
jgi:formylglycine-generating enzyme required for sulfatase activity